MTAVYVLSGATTGAPPGDYVASGSSWNVIGGGSGGSSSTSNTSTAAGGGGGAWAQIVNVTWTLAQTCSIGTGGQGGQVNDGLGASGLDTWARIDGGGAAPATTAQGVLAKGSIASLTVVATHGVGGLSTTSVGTTKNAGGSGGTTANSGFGSSGGGGAGGPGGIGGTGGNDVTTTGGSGAGGGANGGGGNGVANTAALHTGTAGGNSITNGSQTGTTGGAGGAINTVGTAGTQGAGGGGGGDSSNASAAGNGGAGGPGQEWDSTHGSGAGGGGGGGGTSTGAPANGGNGGLYGGGGGAGGVSATTFGKGGNGAAGILAILYTPAGGTVTIAWSRPSDPERLPAIRRPPDEPFPFFQRSLIPVPARWLPITGQEDRPAAQKKPPDENTGFFVKFVTTTPNNWLPTAGEAEKRPPIQRTDWAPQWFARSPNPVPASWLPQPRAEEARPVAVRQAPDEGIDFFFRSPASFPAIWLPQPRAEEARPVIIQRNDWSVTFFAPDATALTTFMAQTNGEDGYQAARQKGDYKQSFVPLFITAKTPSTWIKYSRDDPERLPSLKQPDERVAWAPRSFVAPVGISGIAWYVLQEGMRPPQPPDRYTVTWLAQQPIAAASTIAGMAWWNPPDTRPLRILGDPYAIQMLPPFIGPPLQPFLAQTNADDFNPLKAFTFEEQSRGLTLRPIAAPVGIAGIAWWQSVEVHLAPPPLRLDYRSSYAANVPTAPVGISGMAWFRSAEQIIRPPSIDQNWSPSWVPFVTSSGFQVAWAVPSNYITGGVAT